MQVLRRVFRLVFTGLVLTMLLIWPGISSPVRSLQAQGVSRAGLVVVYGADRVSQMCIAFSEAQLPGADLLRRGVGTGSVIGSVSPGVGEAICRIDDVGCNFPGEQCFCACLGQPCIYWSYWYWKDGAWVYSGKGAGSRVVRDGDIDAWVWGDGNSQPPAPAAALCAETPTATSAPPTQTPTLTNTPEPSSTPTAEKTATQQPSETPSPTQAPSATASLPATATLTRTRTPTPTRTPTQTLAPPTATPPPDAYPAEATSTPAGAYPGVTATHQPTPTYALQATWTIGPSVTPQPSFTLEMELRSTSSLATDPSQPFGSDSQGTNAAYPSGTQEPAQVFAEGMPPSSEAQQSVEPPGAQASAPASETAQASMTSPTPDKVAMLLSTSIAKSHVTPAPPRAKQRVARRQYGAFVGIALFLLVSIGYAVLLRRQRERQLR